MKKYRYVEFTDGYWGANAKNGLMFINAEKPENYVEEFSLKNVPEDIIPLLKK